MDLEKKYELIPSDKEGFYRVKALKDFGHVKKGDIGGYIQDEHNLSQLGDCWIYNDAVVWDNAVVMDNAQIYDNAVVMGNALICRNAVVCDKVQIWGNAIVYDTAYICGDAVVSGGADICGNAIISSNKDYIVFKNWWTSGRYFTWTRSNNKWKVGCFYGTGEQLIAKAYKDSEEKGKEYERIVKYIEIVDNF